MRILHLIQRYYPAQGGAEIHFHEFSSRLAADGHQVTVATTDAANFETLWDPHKERLSRHEETVDGVLILRFPVRHLPFSPLAYASVRRFLWLASGLHLPTAIAARASRYTPWVPSLWRWLETAGGEFDLVAGMTLAYEPLLEAGLHYAQKEQIPFVAYPLTHLGAGPKPGEDAISRFYTMRHQVALMRASDAIVAQTPSERDFYLRQGVPQERIAVVGPGVTPAAVKGGDASRGRQRYGLQGPVVLSLGTMSYDKGTVHTVEAVRLLWQQGCDLELVLAGAISARFQDYVDALPPATRDRIQLLGSVSDEAKRDLLAACDLFALPSRSDSFGIVYLEAWLYRKPVIAADTWGVNDVVTAGKDGLLVRFGEVEALAEAISYLLQHSAEAAAMGARGEDKVYRQHTWEAKYEQIRQIYQDLAA